MIVVHKIVGLRDWEERERKIKTQHASKFFKKLK